MAQVSALITRVREDPAMAPLLEVEAAMFPSAD